MPDPILEAAYQITSSGDALFKGDSNEIYVVHTSPIREGQMFHTGGVSVFILRSATAEEYMERCPQVPALGLRKKFYFYLGTLTQQPKRIKVCQRIEGAELAHCPLTDTVLSPEEFKMYACVENCNMEKFCR